MQTIKALELGAPITTKIPIECDYELANGELVYPKNIELFNIPTAEEMIGWLRSKNIQFHFDDETNYWNIGDANDDLTLFRWCGYSDNKELAAIDAALEYLSNNKWLITG